MGKKIAIIGSALSGNKGAAAMLESALQTLGGKDVEFTLLSMYPLSDAKQNTYKNLTVVDASPLKLGVVINSLALLYRILPPLRAQIRKHDATRAILEADVLLDQGGITFVDGREKFLIYNVASILPALNLKTPVVKCAQALGPFKNPINRLAAKIYLPKMRAIVSRGAITHEYLETLNLDNVTAGADYAFSLDLTKDETASAKKKFSKPANFSDRTIVGLSPSVVMQKKIDAKGGDYAQEMIDFVNYLTGAGYGVVLVPHSVRSNTDKTHNNDMPLCKTIYSEIKDEQQVMFLDEELSSQELRYWIGETDIFVASRFHAMVSSLATSVPTLVIGWSHKYKEVLDMFELSEWAFGGDKLSHAHLVNEFNRLVENKKKVEARLKKHLPEVKKRSAVQVDVIKEVVG